MVEYVNLFHKWPTNNQGCVPVISSHSLNYPFLRTRFVDQCALSMSNTIGNCYHSGDQRSLPIFGGFWVAMCSIWCLCLSCHRLSYIWHDLVEFSYCENWMSSFSPVVQCTLKWRVKIVFVQIFYLRNLWWVWFLCSNIF